MQSIGVGLVVILAGALLVLRVLHLPARVASTNESVATGWTVVLVGAAVIALGLLSRSLAA